MWFLCRWVEGSCPSFLNEDEARLHLLKEKPRHFIQESLPRIRYANPDLDIEVVKWRKEKNDHWRPELALTFGSFFFFSDYISKFLIFSFRRGRQDEDA